MLVYPSTIYFPGTLRIYFQFTRLPQADLLGTQYNSVKGLEHLLFIYSEGFTFTFNLLDTLGHLLFIYPQRFGFFVFSFPRVFNKSLVRARPLPRGP